MVGMVERAGGHRRNQSGKTTEGQKRDTVLITFIPNIIILLIAPSTNSDDGRLFNRCQNGYRRCCHHHLISVLVADTFCPRLIK